MPLYRDHVHLSIFAKADHALIVAIDRGAEELEALWHRRDMIAMDLMYRYGGVGVVRQELTTERCEVEMSNPQLPACLAGLTDAAKGFGEDLVAKTDAYETERGEARGKGRSCRDEVADPECVVVIGARGCALIRAIAQGKARRSAPEPVIRRASADRSSLSDG